MILRQGHFIRSNLLQANGHSVRAAYGYSRLEYRDLERRYQHRRGMYCHVKLVEAAAIGRHG